MYMCIERMRTRMVEFLQTRQEQKERGSGFVVRYIRATSIIAPAKKLI